MILKKLAPLAIAAFLALPISAIASGTPVSGKGFLDTDKSANTQSAESGTSQVGDGSCPSTKPIQYESHCYRACSKEKIFYQGKCYPACLTGQTFIQGKCVPLKGYCGAGEKHDSQGMCYYTECTPPVHAAMMQASHGDGCKSAPSLYQMCCLQGGSDSATSSHHSSNKVGGSYWPMPTRN
jgi:hypothetical protein